MGRPRVPVPPLLHRLSVPDVHLPQRLQRTGRLPRAPLRGIPELHPAVRRSGVLADRAELIRLHHRIGGHPPPHRAAPGVRPQPELQGQAAGPGADPHSLRHPDRAVLAGLEMDVRLALQRDQLDAHAGRPDRLPVAVARRAGSGHVVGDHPERLARLPVLGGGPARRAHRRAAGGHPGRQDRRGRAPPPLPLRGGPHDPPHPARRSPVLRRLLLHRLLGGVAPDPGRSLQHDPRVRHLRLQHRHQRRRHRNGRRDHPLHLPGPGRDRHPVLRFLRRDS